MGPVTISTAAVVVKCPVSHAFTVGSHTANQEQTRFCPFVPHKIAPQSLSESPRVSQGSAGLVTPLDCRACCCLELPVACQPGPCTKTASLCSIDADDSCTWGEASDLPREDAGRAAAPHSLQPQPGAAVAARTLRRGRGTGGRQRCR